ncbi:MAG: hypothetical protein SFX73_16455 [Kofleriaceae bacterium]|nr:hypothetical protein [Kofleriaceae bacterium]
MTRRRPSNLFLLVLGVGCLSDSVHYTHEQDTEALSTNERAWTAPGGLNLSLCEDVSVPDTEENDCQVQHVVRGDNRGREHEESTGGVGCGGCPFANVAYVRGTVSGGTFAQPVTVTGTVSLGYAAGDDPYDYPYAVDMQCMAPADCSLGGMLEADGTVNITFAEGLGDAGAQLVFTPGGAASCP